MAHARPGYENTSKTPPLNAWFKLAVAVLSAALLAGTLLQDFSVPGNPSGCHSRCVPRTHAHTKEQLGGHVELDYIE